MPLTGSHPLDHAIAGFIAASTSTLLLHPLDLIKTRLQRIVSPHYAPII